MRTSELDYLLTELPAPIKNRFFYGMLLTKDTLFLDQNYFESKRAMLNRLTLGSGVLAGMRYRTGDEKSLYALNDDQMKEDEPTPSEPVTSIRLTPGVAIDTQGREIVIPANATLKKLTRPIALNIASSRKTVDLTNPAEFLKEAQRKLGWDPADDKNKEFYLILEIRYNPQESDTAPVRAGGCPTKCEASAVLEDFEIHFRPLPKTSPELVNLEVDPDKPPKLADPNEEAARANTDWPNSSLLDVFELEPDEAVRHRHLSQLRCNLVSAVLPPRPDARDCKPVESWVPLGVFHCLVEDVDRSPSVQVYHIGRFYHQIFSNDALSKLVFGLAERVDEALRVRVLTHAKDEDPGDCQTADVYHELDKPLVVQVLNGQNVPPSNAESVHVEFRLLTNRKANGRASVYDPANKVQDQGVVRVPIDNTGSARVNWLLGKRPGIHTVAARIVPSVQFPPFHPGSQVVFQATARSTAPTILEARVVKEHVEEGQPPRFSLHLTFSRKLNPDRVQELDKYFKAWSLYRHGKRKPLIGPKEITISPKMDTYRAVGFTKSDDDKTQIETPWQITCALEGPVVPCKPHYTARVALLGNIPDADGSLASVPSERFPQPQVLDAAFDDTYLPWELRKRLWRGDKYLEDKVDLAVKNNQPTLDQESVHVADDAVIDLQDLYWDRFRSKHLCFPTGHGFEGAEVDQGTDFHMVFEFEKC